MFEVTIDAKLPSKLAAFWAQALIGYTVRPYDQAEIDRLAAQGFDPETDPTVPIDGPGPTIWFQKSEQENEAPNRLHFDLKYNRRDHEQARLEGIGAAVREYRTNHTVMLDPEGNQFCLFDP